MNKKILGVFISILAVTMLIVPISPVLVKNPEPETETLEGVYLLLACLNQPRQFYAGESGHYQWKARDLPVAWDLGDIVTGTIDPGGNLILCSPGGYYNGNWVTFNQGTEDEVIST